MTPAQIAMAHQLRGSAWTAADLAASFHITQAEFLAQCPFWGRTEESRPDGLPNVKQFRVARFYLEMAVKYACAADNDYSLAGSSSRFEHNAGCAIRNLEFAAITLGFDLVPINPQPTPERNG